MKGAPSHIKQGLHFFIMAEDELILEKQPVEENQNIMDDEPEEAEMHGEGAPIPAEQPASLAFIRESLYDPQIPQEIQQTFWGVHNLDVRMGNLRPEDEIDIRYGYEETMLIHIQVKRKNEGSLTWEELMAIKQFETVLPAILSRGRGGFERTAQVTQLSVSLSGTSVMQSENAQKQESRIKSWMETFQNLLG